MFLIFRHRILRHTAVICTSRSLNVRATVCRSNSLEDEEGRGGNMLVFVDVENTNTVSYFKPEFCFKVYLEMFGVWHKYEFRTVHMC